MNEDQPMVCGEFLTILEKDRVVTAVCKKLPGHREAHEAHRDGFLVQWTKSVPTAPPPESPMKFQDISNPKQTETYNQFLTSLKRKVLGDANFSMQ